MTTTTTTIDPALPPGAEPADWYTIDHDGLPTSTGRTVHTPNLTPYPAAPDVRVECVQHPDGSYDANSLVVRVGGEEFSGDDARKIARSLTQAAEVFQQWSLITEPQVQPIECTAWCTDNNGHPNEIVAEDQTCRGEVALTNLSLVDQSEPGEVSSYSKRYNGGTEHVCLNVFIRNVDVDVPMTVAEARDIGHALIEAASEIDPAGNQTTE